MFQNQVKSMLQEEMKAMDVPGTVDECVKSIVTYREAPHDWRMDVEVSFGLAGEEVNQS